MTRSILVLATAFGLAGSCASAADLGSVAPLPTPDAVAAAPANNWTGFYLGALLGYSWGKADTAAKGNRGNLDGIDGGAYAGADWQFGNLMVGVEADLLATGASGTTGGLDLSQGLNGSLRARAGIALDQFLLYGTAGAAATDLQLSRGGKSDDKTLLGWTIGAGAEAMLAKNITARVEYRYTDYENKTFTLGGGPAASDLSTNTVRAGIGVKF